MANLNKKKDIQPFCLIPSYSNTVLADAANWLKFCYKLDKKLSSFSAVMGTNLAYLIFMPDHGECHWLSAHLYWGRKLYAPNFI